MRKGLWDLFFNTGPPPSLRLLLWEVLQFFLFDLCYFNCSWYNYNEEWVTHWGLLGEENILIPLEISDFSVTKKHDCEQKREAFKQKKKFCEHGMIQHWI